MKSALFAFLLISSLCFVSCSNPKSDYADVKKLLDENEIVLNQSSDFDAKAKACDNVIKSLDEFIGKHSRGEWTDVAKANLTMWEDKREKVHNEIAGMNAKLEKSAQSAAIKAAIKMHPASDFDGFTTVEKNMSAEAGIISIEAQYSINMRGAFLGLNEYVVKVSVAGQLDMSTKKVGFSKVEVVE